MKRAFHYVVPLCLFLGIALLFYFSLGRDPRELRSPLIGKPAPAFDLPNLLRPDRALLSSAYLQGQPYLLNAWGSWCVACKEEHAALMAIAALDKIAIIGLNLKDEPQAAEAWLRALGNPYQAVAIDRSGETAIDYGVYGAPESFLIDAHGIVRFKHVGPLTVEAFREKMLPLLEKP